jgi:hypothetical protein
MSKLFFDHLISFEEVEVEIKKNASSVEEREELWHEVDTFVNHRVLEKILDKLPKESHIEFLELFHRAPHDEEIIFGYLKVKAGQNIEEKLREDLKDIGAEILKELRPQDEVATETKVSKK